VLIPFYLVWEWKFTKYPVVAKRFVLNRAVVLASLIGAFDFVRLSIYHCHANDFSRYWARRFRSISRSPTFTHSSSW